MNCPFYFDNLKIVAEKRKIALGQERRKIMAEVLEIEKIDTDQKRELPTVEKNTWILKLPTETCRREGLAEGTMVSLTVKDHGIQATFVRPLAKIDDFVNRVVKEEKEYFEEMKRLGD